MPEAVFFDLDGTLIDTAPDFYVVLNALLADAGRSSVSMAAVRSQVSNGARALVTLGFSLTSNDPGFDHWLDRLLLAYEKRLDVDTCLFPGMDQVLDHLQQQDIPWGVVTNKPERFTLPVLKGLNLEASAIICPDHVQQRKPHPEGLLLACQQTGSDPMQCFYVGDHERDIAAGRNAGMTTVAACYGYIDANDDPHNWQADYYIDRAEMLIPLLQDPVSMMEP